jgi:hypothetical protein
VIASRESRGQEFAFQPASDGNAAVRADQAPRATRA